MDFNCLPLMRVSKVARRRWRRKAVFKVTEILLNSIDVYDSEHIGNEGGEACEGAAMYNGESLRSKE